MSEWKETTLGELINFTTGKLNSNAAVIHGEYPFFTCSPETLNIDTYAFDCNAILLAGNNANGQYPIKIYDGKFNAYQRTYVITPKNHEKVDLDYLYYLLSIRLNYFKEISQGSATKFLTAVILRNLSLELPPINEQKDIAATLSCLDRKIENLRRQNEMLEAIAQTLFKHWFVDFEFPNADGKPYKSSGGAMEPSELGKIPAGWKVRKFWELGELNRGKSKHRPRYADHLYGGIYPFIQTGDVKEAQGFITEYQQTYSEAGLAQSRLWHEETLCITIAANIAETGILTFPACFPDSVIGFIANPEICDVYFIRKAFNFKRRKIESEAIGSVQKNLNLRTIEKVNFCIPNLKKHKDIIYLFRKLGKHIENNKEQVQTLVKTRDVLLPKLMSGKLRIKP